MKTIPKMSFVMGAMACIMSALSILAILAFDRQFSWLLIALGFACMTWSSRLIPD